MPAGRTLLAAVVVTALGAAGCGADPERRFELRTPPERQYAQPLAGAEEPAAAALAGKRVSRADARRQRPVLAAWARALRRGDEQAAARFFAVPALINQTPPMQLTSREQVRAFNAGLPCGARLVAVGRAGRYVIGTFKLTRRPDNECDAPGDTIRVGFLIRKGRFREWRQVQDTPGAERELARPEGSEDEPATPSRSQPRA